MRRGNSSTRFVGFGGILEYAMCVLLGELLIFFPYVDCWAYMLYSGSPRSNHAKVSIHLKYETRNLDVLSELARYERIGWEQGW